MIQKVATQKWRSVLIVKLLFDMTLDPPRQAGPENILDCDSLFISSHNIKIKFIQKKCPFLLDLILIAIKYSKAKHKKNYKTFRSLL